MFAFGGGTDFLEGVRGSTGCRSVGVGGVTVVSGVSSEALTGVLGVVSRDVRLAPLDLGRLGSVRMGCGTFGGFSEALEALRELRLFENIPPNVFPLPEDFIEARSGLVFGLVPFFLNDGMNTSFILVAGETSRDPPPPASVESSCELPCEGSNVAACRGARLVSSDVLLAVIGKVVALNCGGDGVSSIESNRGMVVESASEPSGAVVLIKGDDEVRYPVCESWLTSGGGEASRLLGTTISVSNDDAKRLSKFC